MKIYILAFFLCFFALNLSAENFTEQKGGHVYTMEIPDYMVKTYELNEVASLQYKSLQKFSFLVVIDDEKAKLENVGMKFVDAKVFLDVFLETYNVDAINRKVSKTVEFTNNGNKHAQTEMTWSEDKTDYYMIITIVETKDYYYKILNWSTAKNKDKLKADFLRTAKSLKD